jgi:vancomycin resistance protein YoaR
VNLSAAWKATGLALGAVLVFGIAAVLGFEITTWNRITPGVSVLDVSIGGLTVQEAQSRLTPRTLAILDQQLTLQLDDRHWETSARALGVRLDSALLAQSAYALGRDGAPLARFEAQLDALHGGVEVPVIEQADGAQLDALVADIAAQVDTPAVAAHLSLDDTGALDFGTSATGLQLDQAASRTELAQALTSGAAHVRLASRTLTPALVTEQVAAAHEQLQRILAPQPVRLSAAEYSRTLERADVLELIVLNMPTSAGGVATVTIKADAEQPLLDEAAHAVERRPINARMTWNGSRLGVTRPSTDGRSLDRAAASELLGREILAGTRAIQLPVMTVKPDVPADEAAASLGQPVLIEESTTAFAGAVPEKAHNIKLAAERLNGVVVAPGATFSFNAEVGPTTLESGFKWGFGLVTGAQGAAHTVPSVAGGICQVATTLFQSVYWAGYQLEERYWHLYWIPAYTSRDVVGLDATVDEDSGLDFKWINPTDDFVLIQSATDAEHVTFRLYGRKPSWSVRLEPPVISNRVAPDPTPDVQEEPLLQWGRVVPVETARDGFQVVVTRHVIGTDPSKTRDLVLKSIYQPGHNVTLVGTGGAPDAAAVAAAVDRVRGSMQPAAPRAAPSTYETANGQRTIADIRDELRRAGWGGGSDQDAVATYKRLADAAAGR